MRVTIRAAGSGRPFTDGDSLDLGAPLVVEVDDVVGLEDCRALIADLERRGPAPAPISTLDGFVMRPDLRNNTRVMYDDAARAAALFAALAGVLPARLRRRHAVGINERFRGYKYTVGQRFAPHYDGAFVRSPREASELTLIVYLNDDFTGGTTDFPHLGLRVQPRAGRALLFQHLLLHEGCAVEAGVKYALRTDVMYAD